MMFEVALALLREGKKICRPSFRPGEYLSVIGGQVCLTFNERDFPWLDSRDRSVRLADTWEIMPSSLLADDWEVV